MTAEARPALTVSAASVGRAVHVDLRVGGGEIVGVCGVAGSGALDLVRCLFGLAPLLAGSIELGGLLGRSLRSQASVIVLHEPTTGIDHRAKGDLLERIRDAAERGGGVLLVSTDIRYLVQLCDRIVVMREGRVASEWSGPDCSEGAVLQAAVGGGR